MSGILIIHIDLSQVYHKQQLSTVHSIIQLHLLDMSGN